MQTCLDRGLDFHSRGGFTPEECPNPVPHTPYVLLKCTEEFSRAHKFLPSCQHFPAQQRTVLGCFQNAKQGVVVFVNADGAQLMRRSILGLQPQLQWLQTGRSLL